MLVGQVLVFCLNGLQKNAYALAGETMDWSRCCLLTSLLLLFVSGCGGGGGSGGTSPNPPPTSQANPAGVWFGTATNTTIGETYQVVGVSTANGEFRFLDDAGVQYQGTMAVSENRFSATLRGLAPLGTTFGNGLTVIEGTISGSIADRNSITAEYSYQTGDRGTINLVYDAIHARNSSLAFVSGNWADEDGAVYSVSSTGTVTGTNALGCGFTGQVSIIDPAFNTYRIRLTVTSCGQADGNYSGLGVLRDRNLVDNGLFTFQVSNSVLSLTSELARTKPVPVILNFSAAESIIRPGSSTTITSTFTGGTGVIAGLGVIQSGAQIVVSPAVSTTYELTVTNDEGLAVTAEIAVEVRKEPSVTSFGVASSPILPGQTTSLVAVFSDGQGTVDNGIGRVVSGVPVTVAPTLSTTYTLTVSNDLGWSASAQASVIVVTVPPPSITSFTVDDAQITAGESARLTAVFFGGEGSIDNGVGPVSSGVPIEVAPENTTTYTLEVVNDVGVSITRQVTVTVLARPVIEGFTAVPSIITSGGATALRPVFANGEGVIDNGVGAVVSGEEFSVQPDASMTYRLTVTNSDGFSVSAQATVEVVAAPTISSFIARDYLLPLASSTTLIAEFAGGIGVIDNGVGSIVSGVPVSISPERTTAYTLTVTNSIGSFVSEQLTVTVTGAFTQSAARLAEGRGIHTATRLPDGTVLLTGGYSPIRSSAEVYDPVTDAFSRSGDMSAPRFFHTATRLPSGSILIVGGSSGADALASAELFNPLTGAFELTGSLRTARHSHTATLLPNGKVLIAGGTNNTEYFSSAEIYDPDTGTFSDAGVMVVGRRSHTATLLGNGAVLVIGGYNDAEGEIQQAEIFDPNTNGFAADGMLNAARHSHTATVLGTGEVLVAGGVSAGYLSSAEIYDPTSSSFTLLGNMTTPRAFHAADVLPNGQILLVGGIGASVSTFLASAEIYDPEMQSFSPTGAMTTPRYNHTATVLEGGDVLVVGGVNGEVTGLDSAEIYRPYEGYRNTYVATDTLSVARTRHSATTLPNGKVLISGGHDINQHPTDSLELYDPSTGTYNVVGAMTTRRVDHGSALLTDGTVLIAGGHDGFGYAESAEIYDPISGVSASVGSMNAARGHVRLTVLPDGKVLASGGYDSGGASGALSSAEVYDPVSQTFTLTGSMSVPRHYHTATLLSNGTVLVAGGHAEGNTFLASAEIYDPKSGEFSLTNPMNEVRRLHTATNLGNGLVLIAGGDNFASLMTAELYDPRSRVFSLTGTLNDARRSHSAVRLPDGRILIVGGYDSETRLSIRSSEVYSSASGTFSTTGELLNSRAGATLSGLSDGTVLVTGGIQTSASGFRILGESELYE